MAKKTKKEAKKNNQGPSWSPRKNKIDESKILENEIEILESQNCVYSRLERSVLQKLVY